MAHMGGNYEKSSIETSEQELEYRMSYNNSTDEDQKQAPLCTICSCDLSPNTIKKEGVYAHQLLGVLLCKKCYNRHNKNDYSYKQLCLWCGLTGEFKVCKGCLSYFCKKCLKRNLTENVCNNIFKNESWNCFICSPNPLWEHRAICARLLHSLVYTKESAHGNRKRHAKNITEHASCSKRKRSNSWGGTGSQEDKQMNGTSLNDFKKFKFENEKKLPSEEECKNMKEELLGKADQLSLLADHIKERLQGFRNKIVSQSCNERVVKKALLFQNELIDTTIKTLNLWKTDLQKINDKWYKEFKISLIPTIISEIQQPENQSDHNPTVEANDHQEEPHNTCKNKFNLKLKRTSNTQFTDDDVKDSDEDGNGETNNVEELSTENKSDSQKTDKSEIELPDDLEATQLIENPTIPDNNSVIPNPEAVSKNEDSDEDSIFSQATEIINPNDELETDVHIENVTQSENDERILCEMSGYFISETSIPMDDVESEKSFVFDISDSISDVSSVNGI